MGSLNPEDYSVSTGNIDTRTIVRFLWKKFNNTVNALPGDTIEVETKNFDNTIFLNGVLNKYIPKTIDINSSKNYIFELKNVYNNNIEVSFNINGQIFENKSITSINIDKLRKLDEELDNYVSNYKFSENTYLDLEMFGEQYKYLRYYNKLKLHTIYDRNKINSWSATTPSNEILSDLNPINIILKNIIPKQYDSSNKNTYNFKLSIDDNDINYFTPDFYYIVDTKNGLVIFLGDISNITSNPDDDFIQSGSIKLHMDSNVNFSFIKYIGPTGFDDAELSGNIKVDGCLNIFGNLNISGGSLLIDGSNITDYLSTTNGTSLTPWSDASFTNVDISGQISIFNYQSYNDISDISNIVLNNQQIKELINYYLSGISPTGATTLQNNLFVQGNTQLQDLSAGATDISSTLNVKGVTNLENNLILHGSFIINDTDLSQYLLESSSNKIYYRNNNTFPFDISQILVTNADEKDCSNILYAEIQPTTSNKKIFISINFEYICSSAYQERITIKLLRDNTLIKKNLNLGTINSSGEYRGIYNVSLIDNPSTSNLIKYYIKFQLETNNYNTPLGLINLTGSASITLIEF